MTTWSPCCALSAQAKCECSAGERPPTFLIQPTTKKIQMWTHAPDSRLPDPQYDLEPSSRP